jgi:hypothetical protein
VPAKSAAKEPTERTDDPVRMYLREMGSVDARTIYLPEGWSGSTPAESVRYSWTKNKRSPFVSWTRPRILRRSTIN